MTASVVIKFPEGFEGQESIVEAKGWLSDVLVAVDDACFRLTFCDPVRLGQTVGDEVRRDGLFYERNLVVVPAVTRARIEAAVAKLGGRGLGAGFLGDPDDHIQR